MHRVHSVSAPDPMTLTYATAATQYVQAGATRYAYRHVGRDSGVPLLFLQSFRQGMADHVAAFVGALTSTGSCS